MKLNITKKQYKYLLEICLFGVYIIEKSKVEVEDEYKELLKHIIFLGEEFSFNKVDDNILEDIEEVASTIIKNSNIKEDYIIQYNEKIFWQELAARMAARDALDELGETINEENFSEYIKLTEKYKKKYIEKFELANYNNRELPY